MENLVFTTFADAKNATDGLEKLKELDQLGDIVIYNLALIKKNADGTYTLLHHEGPDAADQPAQGALVGSLVGLLAGPVGMAVGMLTGVMAGAVGEDETEDVTRQFLDKANVQLSPGSLAIVMDVEEDTTFMIDSYMAPYQGVTMHSPIEDEYDENDQAQASKREKHWHDKIKELNKKVSLANSAAREKLSKKISYLQSLSKHRD
jgi:uncharacterized membrane protein